MLVGAAQRVGLAHREFLLTRPRFGIIHFRLQALRFEGRRQVMHEGAVQVHAAGSGVHAVIGGFEFTPNVTEQIELVFEGRLYGEAALREPRDLTPPSIRSICAV